MLFMAKTIDLLTWLKGKFNTKEEITTALNGKADANHEHGDLYYTESEMDTMLAGKAESNQSQFICSVVSDSLRPHESQHARPSCPSSTPGVYPNSCPSSW